MKALRLFAALFVAFGSLFFATPAQAQILEEAQAALAAGQQELVSATQDKFDVDALVASASQDVTDAETALAAAQTAYDATRMDYPEVTTSGSGNVVLNGTFDTASNWSNIGMGSPSTVINSNIARVYNGVLIGSYTYGTYIQQVGTFTTPTRSVTFSYDMSNNNFNDGARPQADGYRVEFRTYNAAGQRLNYYNTGDRADTFGWTHFTATYNLQDDAVRWDIGFRLGDNGYWNGNFAGSIDNVSLITATTVTVPAHTTYGAAETTALAAAQLAVTSARTAYATALVTQANAAARLQAASDAIPILEAAVVALTPVVPVTPPWWAQQNYEGDTVTITAPDGWEFYSVRAWYGSPDDWNCGADVSSELGALMIGQHSVTVNLDNGTFGDPCGGVVKVTRFTWSIVPQTSTPAPTPTATPQSPEPTAEPSSTPAPEIQPTPTTSPEPQPSQPEPSPAPEPVPPVVTPPVIEPAPQPQPIPFPVEPEPQPEPVVTPQPEPVPTPSETETPAPVVLPPVVEPTPEPVVVEPSPEPPVVEPTPEPKPEVPVLSEKPTVTETVAVMDELTTIAPEKLTDAQVEVLVAAAEATFLIAAPGSPAYEQALDALAVAAQADDLELPEELAAIPGAAQVLEAFNALGNVGADMSPKQREATKKQAIAIVAVGQVAAASAAAAMSAGSASSRRNQ